MKYQVVYDVRITTRYFVEIDAESPEDAYFRAEQHGDGRRLKEEHQKREASFVQAQCKE